MIGLYNCLFNCLYNCLFKTSYLLIKAPVVLTYIALGISAGILTKN